MYTYCSWPPPSVASQTIIIVARTAQASWKIQIMNLILIVTLVSLRKCYCILPDYMYNIFTLSSKRNTTTYWKKFQYQLKGNRLKTQKQFINEWISYGLRFRDLMLLLVPDVSPKSVADIFRGLAPVLLFVRLQITAHEPVLWRCLP